MSTEPMSGERLKTFEKLVGIALPDSVYREHVSELLAEVARLRAENEALKLRLHEWCRHFGTPDAENGYASLMQIVGAENAALKAEAEDWNSELERNHIVATEQLIVERKENAALKAELRNTQMHLRTAEERLAERTAELEAARADSARLMSIEMAYVAIETLELIWPTIPIDAARAEAISE